MGVLELEGVTPGESAGMPSFQTYQLCLGLVREEADSSNHLALSEVWLRTMSRTTRMW